MDKRLSGPKRFRLNRELKVRDCTVGGLIGTHSDVEQPAGS